MSRCRALLGCTSLPVFHETSHNATCATWFLLLVNASCCCLLASIVLKLFVTVANGVSMQQQCFVGSATRKRGPSRGISTGGTSPGCGRTASVVSSPWSTRALKGVRNRGHRPACSFVKKIASYYCNISFGPDGSRGTRGTKIHQPNRGPNE